ncbi:MAG TPA: condensation domain-containing protein [Streptosporangiaceae bacterium]|nr:condensation domain-containing protein [Streptosporangiaceae bacterium]
MTLNEGEDFAALREPDSARSPGPGQPANSGTGFELAVAQAWAATFGADHPGPDDDFFLAGGDSLTATRLASALQLTTGKEISVEDIFIGQTVGGIAARASAAVADASLPTGSAAVLSSAQRRLWFVEQFVPGVPVHNVVMAEQVTGPLEMAALERAFEQVSTRQAALRWRLVRSDGLPTVTVADPEPITIPVDDLSGLASPAKQAALRALLDDEVHTAIDLAGGPLWRTRVVRCSEREHILVVTVHHIVFDGWSQGILYRELGQAYRRALRGGSDNEPAPAGITFADYAAWTLSRAQRDGPADTAWWVEHLAGAPTVLDLPRDRPRPPVLSFGGATRATSIDAELAADVAQLAMSEGATVGAVLLAAFSVLLRRLTGQHDQVVGIPVADRGRADFEDLIGFFIRVLPLRLRADDDAAFAEHVHRCSDELVAARGHSDAPLEHIVEAVGSQRDLTRNPLFQVMFNVYNFAEARLELDAADVRPWQADVPGSLVDLTLYVIFRDDGIRLEAAYNSDLFDGVRIDALLESYAHLLRFLVRNRTTPVRIASARPPGTQLPDWTSSLPSVIADSPGLLEQVRAAGGRTPDSVAAEDASRVLSYRELLQIVDGIAAALSAAAVRAGDVVAVLAQRTAELPAVLLGVLSTGARWAVVDCELPDAAIDRRLAAIKPRALVRCSGGDAVPLALGRAVPVIDAADVVGTAARRLKPDVPAAERGYLSFTSGTTGEPKAIDAAEAPLVHFLNWYRVIFGLNGDDRFALLGGLAHDPLLRDMFTPLTCGGRLLVPAAGLLRDPVRLLTWLAGQKITVAHVTPQLVRMMAAAASSAPTLESLRLVAAGGDQLTEGDAAALCMFAPHARLLNFYGTTETPQAQAYHEIRTANRTLDRDALSALRSVPVPVGVGIDGAQLLVMSICGQPAAVGELGEVVIRSRYLSNGYVGQPSNGGRFAELAGAGEGRVYRTGDLGRYGPAGTVTLSGRFDDQVKVRGYRVELGEVESVLCSHPDVASAAVRLFEHGDASALHAYVVSTKGAVSESGLIQHARSRLPAYAVPSRVTLLAALPLTAAGKVDRRALTMPGQASYARAASSDTPSGDLERLVLSVWCEVLGVAGIGRDDSFFEIGGNSMAIIEVQARLKQALNRPVLVVDLFRFPTIRSLAGYLAGGQIDTGLLASELRGRERQHRAGRRARRQAQEN